MANSDNVVRGGLTTKHIDVEELLRVVDCTPIDAPVQRPPDSMHTYDAPVPEFVLTRIVGECDALPAARKRRRYAITGPAIVVVTDGSVEVRSGGDEPVVLGRGESAWCAAASPLTLTGPGEAFVANVPG